MEIEYYNQISHWCDMKIFFLLLCFTFTSHSIFPQEKSLSDLYSAIDNCGIHESIRQPLKNCFQFFEEIKSRNYSNGNTADTTLTESPTVDTTSVRPNYTTEELSKIKDLKQQFVNSLALIQKSNDSDKWKSIVIAYEFIGSMETELNQPKLAVESYNLAVKNLKEKTLDLCGITTFTKAGIYYDIIQLNLELKEYQLARQNLIVFEKSLLKVAPDPMLFIVSTLKRIAVESNNSSILVEAAKKLKEIWGLNAKHIRELEGLTFFWDLKNKLTEKAINEMIIAVELATEKIYDGFTSEYGERKEDLQSLKINCFSRLVTYYNTQKDFAKAFSFASMAFSLNPCKEYKDAAKTFSLLSSMKANGWLPCGGEDFVISAGNEQQWYFYQPAKLIKTGNYVESWIKAVDIDFDVRPWLFSFVEKDNSMNANESLDTKSLSSTVQKVSYQKYPQAHKTLSYYKYDSNGNVKDSYQSDKNAQYYEIVPGSIGESLWKFYFGVK